MAVPIDLSLPHHYDVRFVELPPGNTDRRVRYYPGGGTDGGHDGTLIEIVPRYGASWLAMIANGYVSPPACSGLFASPHIDRVCVIAAGRAIEIGTTDPTLWTELPVFPVTHVVVAPTLSALVLCDFGYVTAWGADGPLWKTDLSPADSVIDMSLDGNVLRGVRSILGEDADFALDLTTGGYL